jgi:hypothetical protein
MVNTKTTTKAKPKTAKKPTTKARSASAKTSNASKSSKLTKKTTTKAVAVKSSKSGSSKSVTLDMLNKLNLVKAFIFASLAAAAWFLMNEASYPLSVGYAAKDELISLTNGKTVFVSGYQAILDVQVKWLVVGIMIIAAIFSLLAATKMRKKYEKSVESGVSSGRWIAWGVTSALIVETIALLSGVSDILVLKVVGGLMLVTCALAWVAEKRNKQAGRPVWSEFTISLITGALPWVLILSYAVSTWVWGLIRYPWYVYALYATTLIGFTMLATIQYKHISGWKNTLFLERNYLLIGLVTKAAFAIILILGLQK